MRTGAQVPISYCLPEWLRSPRLPILTGNETRALMPVAFPALLLVLLSNVVEAPLSMSVALAGYAFGCAALAAVAFGHDFTHRTLTLTLVQPVARERLWNLRIKLCLSLVLLLALPAGGGLQVYRQIVWVLSTHQVESVYPFVFFLSVPLVALGWAPFLTLVCRSALAGAVFTICVPAFCLLLAQWLVPFLVAWNLPIGEESFVMLFFLATAGLGGVGAIVAAKRRFLRLEALDRQPSFRPMERVGEVRSARRAIPASLSGRGPFWWQLARKEGRLQVISLVPVAGLVVSVLTLTRPDASGFASPYLLLVTGLWAVVVCVLIGAVGSAEERQLGVIEIQGVLPVRKTRQWLVKTVCLLSLSQVLAVALPSFLLRLAPPVREIDFPEARWWSVAAFLLLSLSLYVSSLSRTTMQAVLRVLPLVPLVLIGLSGAREIERAGTRSPLADPFSWDRLDLLPPYLAAALLSFALCRFAGRNHFSAEIRGSRLGSQLWRLLGLLVGAVIFCLSFGFGG